MGRISVAIDIDAPPEAVWRAVEPVEDHVDWMRDAASIRFTTEQAQACGADDRGRHEGRAAPRGLT